MDAGKRAEKIFEECKVNERWCYDLNRDQWWCELSRVVGGEKIAIDMWFGRSSIPGNIDDNLKQELAKIRDDLIAHIDRDIVLLIEQGKL